MKKMRYFLMLTLAFVGFQSFITVPNWEVSEIMQAIVDLEPMEEVWEKGGIDHDTPLFMLAHDHFPEMPEFTVHGQAITIISAEAAEKADVPIIEVHDFRIKKGKKARLEFTYDGIRVKAVVVKQEGEWKHRSLSITGKGIHHKSLDWTF